MKSSSQQDVNTAEPSASAARLVAVVVTHRRLAQLKRTLAALCAQAETDLAAILVVNNASDHGTKAWLETQTEPRLTVIHSEKNTGGAGGFEAGMRFAMQELSPDWLVVMDDDARPEPGAFATFHTLDLARYDGFAAAVRHPDGTICEMNRPTLNPFWHRALFFRTLFGGGRNSFHLGEDDFAIPGLRAIDGASFVGFFVRASTVAAQGYPDPALFLYGDDAMYTMRLTKAGHRLGFDPSVRFEHDSKTYSVQDPRIRPMWKIYYYHRNLLILYRMAAGWLFVPVAVLYIAKWASNIRYYRGERGLFWRLFWRAVVDGLLRRTKRTHADILALSAQKS